MPRPIRIAFAAPAVLLALELLAPVARADPVSPGEEATSQLFILVLVPAIAIGVLVMGLLTYAMVKFRVRKGNTTGPAAPKTHDRRFETLWTVIPAIILLVVGIASFQTLVKTDTIPTNPDVIIEVNAHQWFWNFNVTYVRNGTWFNTTGSFAVPAGLVVKLVLRSFDVAHSFYLPDFLLKIDVIPGHANVYWFQALKPGEYAIRCAEFCGVRHYTMTATLHVIG